MDYAVAGKYFDDFKVGDEFVTPARTMTEADIVNFAGLSGDYNPVHTDEEYARNTPFKGRIAHGMLVLVIGTGLLARLGILDGTAVAFLGLTWRFIGPVKIGDTIKCKATVYEKKETKDSGRGVVSFGMAIVNQRDEVIEEGQVTMMLLRRSAMT